MQHRMLTGVFLAGAALAVGVTPMHGTSAAVSEQGETAATKRDRAESETKDAAEATRDYAYAQRAEWVRNMKAELAKIKNELDRLSAKVDRSGGAAKADARAKLKSVRKNWVQAKKQLDQAGSATESTWDEVKDRIGKSYRELKDSVEETRQWLSDKIAP